MKRIGILSDTHGYLDPTLATYFSDCDEIWHAGDLGDLSVTETLATWTTLRAVHGNIDDPAARHAYPEDLRFDVDGLSVWLTHIGGHPGKLPPRIRVGLADNCPDLFICGHSHVLTLQRVHVPRPWIFINPGAAGHTGFHTDRTALILTLADQKVSRVQAIQLGPRGRPASRKSTSP